MPFSPDEPRDGHGRWVESGIKVGHAYHAGEYTPGTPYVVHVNAIDGDTVRIGSSAGSEYGPKVPRSAVKHLVNDMSGRIEGTPDSSSPEVNAVLRGEGEFLGRGDDGIAFRVGNKAVKASTVVPYQPMNDYYRTPKDAITRFREQIAVHNGLAYDGVPGVMPVQYFEHGDKAYAVQPFLDTKSTLTPEQLSAVKQSVEEMHKRGITVNDQIQVGVGRDGTVYHYDLGKASKAPTPQRLLDRIDDDHDELKRLYQQHGQKYRRWDDGDAEAMWSELENTDAVSRYATEPGGEARWETLLRNARKASLETGKFPPFSPEWEGLYERGHNAEEIWHAALEAAESAKPKGKSRMKKLAKGVDLHESRDDLTDQTLDLHRMLNSLCEELEAVDWYQQRIDATDDKGLAKVLAHNRDEEVEHAAEIVAWLVENNPIFAEKFKELASKRMVKGEVEKWVSVGHGESVKHIPIIGGKLGGPNHQIPDHIEAKIQEGESHASFDVKHLLEQGEFRHGKTTKADAIGMLAQDLIPHIGEQESRKRVSDWFDRHAESLKSIASENDLSGPFDDYNSLLASAENEAYERKKTATENKAADIENAIHAHNRTSRANHPGTVAASEAAAMEWTKQSAMRSPVFHATTAGTDIMRSGLKARNQLGHKETLGGGPDDTVSFADTSAGAMIIAAALKAVNDSHDDPTVVDWFDKNWMQYADADGVKDVASVDKSTPTNHANRVRARINAVARSHGTKQDSEQRFRVPWMISTPAKADPKSIGVVKAHANVGSVVNNATGMIDEGFGAGVKDSSLRYQHATKPMDVYGHDYLKHATMATISGNKSEQGEIRIHPDNVTVSHFEPVEDWRSILGSNAMRKGKYAAILSSLCERAEKGLSLMPPPSPNRKEYPFVGSLLAHGIPVAIENAKGSYREGTGKDGKKWRVLMHAHYGEIGPIAASGPGSGKKWNTRGTDGDRVDVYVLDHDPEYETAYIVDQLDPDTGEFDEQKVILGASSSLDAKDLYFKQYDKPERFFGGIHAMPIETFKRRLMGPGKRGELIKGFNASEPRDENGRWTGDGSIERGQSETGKPKKIPWSKIRTSTAKIPKKLEDKVSKPEIWRRALIRRHLGRNMPDDEIAALCGVEDAEDYHVSVDTYCVTLSIKHPEYKMAREFFREKGTGDLVCNNSYFEAYETRTGLGSKVFSKQVATLKDAGFKRMETLAARGDVDGYLMNGYYTWPRLGYNGEIPSNVKLPPDLASAKTLHDLMKTQQGRAFWKRNGGSMFMNFDLSDGSDSMRVLDAYRQERGL